MKTSELLSRLRDLNVKLWLDGQELKVSAPKGALTAELKGELGARKKELIELLGTGARVEDPAAAAEAVAPIRPVPRSSTNGGLPLSFTQQRLWFLDQMEPGLVTYNMWVACTMRGPLDVVALQRSLREIVRRHEILRTTFRDEGGIPTQVVAEEIDAPLDVVDRGAERIDREEVRQLLWRRLEEPFDLAAGPLLRPILVRIDETEHVLMVMVHHIVFDGLSMGVFLRELSALYEAYTTGTEPQLPRLRIQYADFAAWQRDYFEGPEFRRQADYWKETLGGELPILELPTDRPRPAIQTYSGDVKRKTCSAALFDSLDDLAAREGSTLFLVLLAAFKAFLVRYTGQEDILVGTAMANRGRAELEELIGFFVNTLVLRTDASGEPTFRELLGRVRDTFFGALEHQEMPFERLVDELSPERNLSYSPLFQTLLFLDRGRRRARAPRWARSRWSPTRSTTHVDAHGPRCSTLLPRPTTVCGLALGRVQHRSLRRGDGPKRHARRGTRRLLEADRRRILTRRSRSCRSCRRASVGSCSGTGTRPRRRSPRRRSTPSSRRRWTRRRTLRP